MMSRMFAVSMSLVLCMGALAQDEEGVSLKWKLDKGTKLRYELSQSMEMDFGGMGMEQEILYGMKWEVVESKDGASTIKVTYDRVKVSMSGMMESEFDSKDGEEPDEEDPMAQFLNGFIGKSFKITLDARGNVSTVSGFKDLVEKAMENVEDDTGMMTQMLEGQYNDNQAKMMFQMGLPGLPKKNVSKGDTWKNEETLKIPMLGTLVAKSKSELKSGDDKTAKIETETTMEVDEDDEGGGMGGMVEISEASSKSKSTWDVANGRLKEMNTTTTMKMDAGGQEFEIVVKSSMKHAPKDDDKKKDVPSEDKKKGSGDDDR